ncbi:hypothetical protein [Erwinia psidii]|nr:hypothetical protein [Erwinia psidii]
MQGKYNSGSKKITENTVMLSPSKFSKMLLSVFLTLALAPASDYAKANKDVITDSLAQQNDTVKGNDNNEAVILTGSSNQHQYATIKDLSAGNHLCMTLNADNRNISFSACQNVPRQHWKVSPQMVGFFKITSQALKGQSQEQCLGTTSNIPTMMNCTGSGLQSHRAWQITPRHSDAHNGIFYTLRNKFRNDSARREILGHTANRLAMVSESRSNEFTWQLTMPDTLHTRPVVGVRKILILHAHYSDRAANPLERMRAAVLGTGNDTSSLASAVRLSSYGKLELKGDVVSDINLGPRPATCSNDVVGQAKTLAQQKGIDVDSYNYFFIDIPSTSCAWTALAQIPGNWIIANNNGERHWMWQHEFGHNLGAPHATSLEGCSLDSHGVVQIDEKCRRTTVGDPSDTMNGGGRRLYPAPYVLYAGWLTAEQFPLVNGSGSYTLTPLFDATNSHGVKALRILRSNGSYLTLEYRQASGGFENWSADSPFVHGVIVRIATFGQNVTNQLVDTTPGSANGMADAPLMPGKSVDDLLSGKRITLLRVDAQGAHVRVDDIKDAQDEDALVVPVAIVPQDFSIIARHNSTTIRNLDGRKSIGTDPVWRSLEGNGAFGLQEVASGPIVQEIRQPVARAAFPTGATGKARYQLTVTGSHGVTDSKIVTVTVLPAEAHISGKGSVEHGEKVTFQSQANFDADSWLWTLKRDEDIVAASSQPTFNLDTQHVATGNYQVHLEASANNKQYLATAAIPLLVSEKEPPPAYPAYVEGTAYKAGDRVSAAGGVYSCRPHPFTGWCAGAAWAYAPGTGLHWEQAWNKVN